MKLSKIISLLLVPLLIRIIKKYEKFYPAKD